MNYKNWLNIFDDCNMVTYDANDFYIIRWSVHNDCVLLKNGISIVDDPYPIFGRYNIFYGDKIGVDCESFREEVDRSFDHIREIIVDQYKLSYIKKLIIMEKLRYKNLQSFLKKWKCELLSEEEVQENCYTLKIKDNLGNIYIVDARFDEQEYDDFEPYWSKFEIIGEIRN